MERSARRLLVWSLLGAGVLVLGYVAMVRTGAGQWLDDVALDGRKSTRLAARRLVAAAVHVLTPLVVVVVTAGSVVTAARHRGTLAAVVAGASTLVSLLLARVLKSGLPRHDTLVDSFVGPQNSYPSGHTAVSTTVALMAIAVSPPIWRARVAAVASVAIGLHAVAMAGTGWHRPSDLVGGVGLAVMVSGVASLAVARCWRAAPQDRPTQWFESSAPVARVVGLTVGVAAVWYVVIRLLGTSSYGSFKAHLVWALATAVLAVWVGATHARLVDAADRGRSTPIGGSASGEQ